MQPITPDGPRVQAIEIRAMGAASIPATVESEGAPAAPPKVSPSPSLKLHGATGLVVVQLLDPGTGEVRQQYPTERELKSYEAAMAAGRRPAA